MTLTDYELSSLVKKYQPIVRHTIGEDEQHLMFFLQNNKEISVAIKKNNEIFEAVGQLRNLNQRGFGEASSIMKADSELEVVENILANLIEFDLKRKNR